MATEFWGSQNAGDLALKLTPAGHGRLEVLVDGDKIFDRKTDGGFPDLNKVTELKMAIAEKIFEADEEMANG